MHITPEESQAVQLLVAFFIGYALAIIQAVLTIKLWGRRW